MTKKDKYNLLFLSVLFLFTTILLANFHFIWKDEAYSLITTSDDIITAFRRALVLESQAPLYFVLLNLWRTFSATIFFARLFSIVCILISIYYFYFFSKKNFPRLNPLVVSLLFMFNPFVIWAALEIRLYALVILTSLIIVDVFIEEYINGKQTKKNYWTFTIISLLAVLVHYYMAFLLLSLGIYLLVQKRWRFFLIYSTQMILPVSSLLVIYSLIISQFDSHTSYIESAYSLKEMIYFMYKRVEIYLLPIEELTSNSVLRWTARGILLLLISLFFIHNTSFFKEKKQVYLFMVFALNLFIYAILYLIISEDFVETRHTASLFVLLICLLFQLINNFYKKHLFYVTALLLGLVYLSATVIQNKTPKGSEYTCVNNYLKEVSSYEKPVIIYRNQIHLALQFVYDQENKLIPLPFEVDYDDHYHLDKWKIEDSMFYRNIFNRFPVDTFFVVTDNIKSVYGVNYYPELLENYIHENFYTLESIKCTGIDEIQVRKIVRKHGSME